MFVSSLLIILADFCSFAVVYESLNFLSGGFLNSGMHRISKIPFRDLGVSLLTQTIKQHFGNTVSTIIKKSIR